MNSEKEEVSNEKIVQFGRFLSLRGIDFKDGAKYREDFDKAEELRAKVTSTRDYIEMAKRIEKLREATDIINSVVYTLKLDYDSLRVESGEYLVNSILDCLNVFDNKLTYYDIPSYSYVLSRVYTEIKAEKELKINLYINAVRGIVNRIKKEFEDKHAKITVSSELLSDNDFYKSKSNAFRQVSEEEVRKGIDAFANKSKSFIELLTENQKNKEVVLDFIYERMPESMKSENIEASVVEYISMFL